MLRRFLLNSSVMVAGQLFVKALGLVWLALVARHLGDSQFGHLTYALSLAGIFSIIVEFGFSAVMTRAIASGVSDVQRWYSNVLALRLLFGLVSIPLTVLVSLKTGATRETLAPVQIAALVSLMTALYATPHAVFYGRERMEIPSFLMMGVKVVAVAVGATLVFRGAGITAIAFVFLFEATVNFFVSLPFLKRQLGIDPWPRLDLSFCRGLLREAAPFALTLVAGLIYFKVDVVMLSTMTDSRHVGWYSAGYRLLEGLMYLPAGFLVAVFPALSRMRSSNEESLRTAVGRAGEFVLGLGLPLALLLTLGGDRIIDFFYGDEYVQAVGVLRWIGPAVVFVFLNGFFGMVLGAIHRQTTHFRVSAVAVVVNVALNLYLIPRFAHIGAAQATLVTELMLTAILAIVVIRAVRPEIDFARIAKLLLATAVLGVVLRGLPALGLIPVSLAGAAAYLGVLAVTRAIRPEEMALLKRAIFRGGEG